LTNSFITFSYVPALIPDRVIKVTDTVFTESPTAKDSLTPDAKPLVDRVTLPSVDTTTAGTYNEPVTLPTYENKLELKYNVIAQAVREFVPVEAHTVTVKLDPAMTGDWGSVNTIPVEEGLINVDTRFRTTDIDSD